MLTKLVFEMCNPELENFIISELETLGYYIKRSDGYSKEVRKQIIQILESLGYKVKKKQGLLNFIYYSTNTYVISW